MGELAAHAATHLMADGKSTQDLTQSEREQMKMFNDKIKFYWDDFYESFRLGGRDLYKSPTGIIVGYGTREISSWISDEIHGKTSVDIWLDNINKARGDDSCDGDFGIGNAHWVFLTNNHAMIFCEYVEEWKVLLSFDQLEFILEQYKISLSFNKNEEPDPMDIEYIAEGDEAVRIYSSLDGAYTYPFEE